MARFDAGSEAKMQDILRDAQSALDRRDWKALGAAFLAGATTEDDRSTETREILRDARLELSGLCVLKHRLPEAEEWLQQVLDEYPDDVAACNDLGYLWADQGTHLQRALKMIRHAVAAEPDNAAYRDSLGWVLYRLGRYPEAVAELEKAAAKEPAAEVLDHLGDARLKAGQAEKANRRLAACRRGLPQRQGRRQGEASGKENHGETLRSFHGRVGRATPVKVLPMFAWRVFSR